jgi:hypothetical protein
MHYIKLRNWREFDTILDANLFGLLTIIKCYFAENNYYVYADIPDDTLARIPKDKFQFEIPPGDITPISSWVQVAHNLKSRE